MHRSPLEHCKVNRILYLGLEVPNHLREKNVIHFPMIRIIPKNILEITTAFHQFELFTHIIFTSKSAVRVFMEQASVFLLPLQEIQKKTFAAVGKMTASKLKEYDLQASIIAQEETAEGVVEALDRAFFQGTDLMHKNINIFWPHSSLSRTIISDWLGNKQIANLCLPIYDTVVDYKEPLPSLNSIDEIVFTSPSTVDAFLQGYGKIPEDKILTCIGQITKAHLKRLRPE